MSFLDRLKSLDPAQDGTGRVSQSGHKRNSKDIAVMFTEKQDDKVIRSKRMVQ
jgi:hypothetical protein